MNDVLAFVEKIVSRSYMKDGSLAGSRIVYLTVAEARMIWAAAAWLDVFQEIGVGVQETDFSLEYCRKFLEELKHEAREQMEINLVRRGVRILMDVAIHLDRLAIMKEEDGQSKKRKGGKKK